MLDGNLRLLPLGRRLLDFLLLLVGFDAKLKWSHVTVTLYAALLERLHFEWLWLLDEVLQE